MKSKKIIMTVTAFDSALIASKSFLHHNKGYDITTYTTDEENFNLLEKTNLNPKGCKLTLSEIIKEIEECNCDFLVILSEFTFTKRELLVNIKGKILNWENCEWELAVTPYYPNIFYSDLEEKYKSLNIEYLYNKSNNKFIDFIISDSILIFNVSKIKKNNIKLNKIIKNNSDDYNCFSNILKCALISELIYIEPEYHIIDSMEIRDLIINKQRLELGNINGFRENFKYWDTNLSLKILTQLNLEQYYNLSQYYCNYLIDKSRIEKIELNINRVKKRFGRMIELYTVDPGSLVFK